MEYMFKNKHSTFDLIGIMIVVGLYPSISVWVALALVVSGAFISVIAGERYNQK